MYLTDVDFWEVVKRQYTFKLKAYLGIFTTMVLVQLLAILLSSTGTGSMGSGSEVFSIRVRYYSGMLIVTFMMLWAFITAIQITTKAYRYDDFSFVTNRVSSNVSNILFLGTASLIGGITSILSSILFKLVVYSFSSVEQVIWGEFGFEELAIGMIGTTCYLILFSSLGYFVGTLAQVHKLFVLLVPGVFLWNVMMEINTNREPTLIQWAVEWFSNEGSLLLFMMKVLLTAAILFSSAVVLSDRLEVR